MEILNDISFNNENYLYKHFNEAHLFDIYILDDFFNIHNKNPTSALSTVLIQTICPQHYGTLKKMIMLKGDSNKTAVLYSHGGTKDETWIYKIDNNYTEPVQSWIDQRDRYGYGALIINCCNKDCIEPKVRTTPLFYLEGTMDWLGNSRTILSMPKSSILPR